MRAVMQVLGTTRHAPHILGTEDVIMAGVGLEQFGRRLVGHILQRVTARACLVAQFAQTEHDRPLVVVPLRLSNRHPLDGTTLGVPSGDSRGALRLPALKAAMGDSERVRSLNLG